MPVRIVNPDPKYDVPKLIEPTMRLLAMKTKSNKRHASHRRVSGGRWSARVMRTSNALDLEKGVFTSSDPKKIAASLKRSALRSNRRKANPYRSALSMLTFHINRSGQNLPAGQKRVLERAKAELKHQFARA